MPTIVYQHTKVQPQACNEILNAGSLILVAPLQNCGNLPVTSTLSVTSAGAIGGTSISLQSDNLIGTYLREGHVLHFGVNKVVIALDVTVANSPTTVVVEPLVAAVTGTAETWGMSKILSPTNIPFPLETQTVDRTDLSSYRGSTVGTLNNFKPQVSSIASLKDKALFDVIFDGANKFLDVFVNLVYSSTQMAIGRCKVVSFNSDGNQAEIQRPQFTLEFQGKDYSLYKPWIYEDAVSQVNINNAMQLSGLNKFS